MKNRIFGIDYSMRSSYLGRSATIIVFSAIILLAIGALFLEQDDVAHMTISIGVCAYDSVGVHSILASLADFVREKGGGDIKWRFIREGDEPAGCDLYLMTSLQAAPSIGDGRLVCWMLAAVREGRRYTRGAVITRAGVVSGEGRVIFTSPISAVGFLSPFFALSEKGEDLLSNPDRIDFAGYFPDEERVIYGVLFGAYQAGGIGLERLDYFKSRGMVREGEIEVLAAGASYPEILLAADDAADRKKLESFRRRLLLISGSLPHTLKQDLLTIGIAGFVEPGEGALELLEEIESLVPATGDIVTSRQKETQQ